METKELIEYLKEDLRYSIEQLEDKYLSDRRRGYLEGCRNSVIHYLGLLDAYDESLIEAIKEDYYYRKHEEDEAKK